MLNKYFTLVTAAAGGLWLLAGCSQSEPQVVADDTPPSVPPAAMEVSVAPPDEPEPITEIPIIEFNTAADSQPVEQQIRSFLTPTATAYFQDEDGAVIVPATALELLQRAAYTYHELRTNKHDDSPDWPPLTDVSLLVRYRILGALPTPPPGQKWAVDPVTRKVSVAPQ